MGSRLYRPCNRNRSRRLGGGCDGYRQEDPLFSAFAPCSEFAPPRGRRLKCDGVSLDRGQAATVKPGRQTQSTGRSSGHPPSECRFPDTLCKTTGIGLASPRTGVPPCPRGRGARRPPGDGRIRRLGEQRALMDGDWALSAGEMDEGLDNLTGRTMAPVIAACVPKVQHRELGGSMTADNARAPSEPAPCGPAPRTLWPPVPVRR